MKVLVTGGREFDQWALVYPILDHFLEVADLLGEPLVIVEGGATGADFLARVWAIWRGVDFKEMKADWDAHGNSAGAIRNRKMLQRHTPDLVVAFTGDRGTRDMVGVARYAGFHVVRVKA
ncbi:SLOG family protein [Roseovarius rhodophyticola]|uniref:SLOG family protein n=1 Tax=Roseovarius rhodophyticola TaxID=3080827 RepID=A0ABZ2TGA5_9RHOB|nr:SLOG family protein [Roseovarius sp. W115]MDV2928986.1 SLOG family protein [Roseovarius sp. W115]